MQEHIEAERRWVTKDQATRELSISLSTLDRMIRRGDVEVCRRGRRVYVRVDGPEPPSEQELLKITRDDLATSELTVAALRTEVQQLKDDLRQMTAETQSADDGASPAETSGPTHRETELARKLREARKACTYLTWALITVPLIVAAWFVLLCYFASR